MTKVCSVSLEFLRKGPPHNQLLSPLTDYLALCGNNGASVVQVPYEHQDFLRKLKDLCYQGTSATDPARRQAEIQKSAEEMAKILSSVPGLAAELCNTPSASGVMTHLSMVLSAAELSLLPFELAKVPPGFPGGAGNWLLLQTLAPICLTRRVRSVSSKTVRWPQKPRILFIVGEPRGLRPPPTVEHTTALLKAIAPWVGPFDEQSPSDLKDKTSSILTVLRNATIDQITETCSKEPFTHVHILAHGKEDPNQDGKPYGIALHSPHDLMRIDVVSGSRLATSLKPLRQGLSRENETLPIVVTVASCDSGRGSDVSYNSGASFAHDLHQAGIPFVVASQFPLSFSGSIHMAEILYEQLLWGEDPRVGLHQLRGRLYALHSSDTHDWASLVAYAALPDDLEDQLVDVQYVRAREAIDAAMQHVDRAVDVMKSGKLGSVAQLDSLLERVDLAASRMPVDRGYETEGLGMLGSTAKRKAQALFQASCAMKEEHPAGYGLKSIDLLRKSLEHYKAALADNMSNSQTVVRKKRSAHWALVQCLSLRAVLAEPFEPRYWDSALLSVDLDLNARDPESRAWAHSSAAELYLLLLAYEEKEVRQSQDISVEKTKEKALEHAGALLEIAGPNSLAVYLTLRQFERYVDWWGTPAFEQMLQETCGLRRTRNWREEGGLRDLATTIKNRLPKSEKWM